MSPLRRFSCRKRRAQMIIMAALVMALMIFAVAISVYSAETQYQQLQYDQTTEVIQSISTDFGRALVSILARTSQQFASYANMTTPRFDAFENFTFWTFAASRTYASEGIQLGFNTSSNLLLENASTSSPSSLYSGFNLTTNRYVGNLTKLYWYSPQSLSAIYASFSANSTGLGFYGWQQQELYLLNVTLDCSSNFTSQPTAIVNGNNYSSAAVINGVNYAALNLTVNREGGSPVDDLGNSSFVVQYFDNFTNSWQNANLTVQNDGGSSYSLFLLRSNGSPIPTPFWEYLLVSVTDTRGILVECFTYTEIDYVLQNRAINPSLPASLYNAAGATPENYTLEMLINGSIQWFDRTLPTNINNYVPVPLAPVKQFQVSVTAAGPSTPLIPVTSQVEVWSSDYSIPTLSFASWSIPFAVGDKLVFFVGYPNATVTTQKVQVTWSFDGDAPPPPQPMTWSNPSGSNEWVLNNGVYQAAFHAGPTATGDPVGTDWNLQINSTENSIINYSVDYKFFNYGYEGSSLNAWLPWGNGTNQGWTFLAGPIRAVAYRSDDVILNGPQNSTSTGNLNHTEIILIPYEQPYFELYFNATAESSFSTPPLVDYLTTLSGVNSAQDEQTNSAYRLTSGTFQLESSSVIQTGIVNGTYADSLWPNDGYTQYVYAGSSTSTNANTAKAFGQWLATYSTYRGQATFFSYATIQALKGATSPAHPAMYEWSTSNGGKAVYSLEWQYYNPGNNITITKGTQFIYNAAGWYFAGGGSPSGKTSSNQWLNGNSWTSSGVNAPQMYYLMFNGTATDPLITSITSPIT